jgi:hypothetical protein
VIGLGVILLMAELVYVYYLLVKRGIVRRKKKISKTKGQFTTK